MRDIELVDTFNLRDLGGYPTVDGRRVRWRRLFRGAGLQRLAGRDLETVRALGIVTAIDLRTAAEVEASGTYQAALHLPMIERIWDLDDLDPEQEPHDYLVDRYREMLYEGAPTIAAVFRILAEPGRLPAAFYCAAGKDRTGVLAGLVLDALGVEPEAIASDYHLSRERVERIRARAAARSSTMLVQPPAFMQAPAEAMRLLLDWIRGEHGSTPGYLRAIGVPPQSVTALRAALLEG